MRCLPSKPIARAIEQDRSKPAESGWAKSGPSRQRRPFARRCDNCMHDRMPTLFLIEANLGIEFPDHRQRHLHRCGIIAGAKNKGFETGRRPGNFADGEKPRGRFNLRINPDAVDKTEMRFNLGQQLADETNVLRRVALSEA